MASALDAPLGLLGSRETKQRMDGLAQLEHALASVELDADTVSHIVGSLVPVICDNNPKMCVGAMQLLQQLASGPEFGALALSAWPNLIERMGDSKVSIRTAATATIVSCMAVRARRRVRPAQRVSRLAACASRTAQVPSTPALTAPPSCCPVLRLPAALAARRPNARPRAGRWPAARH